MAAAGGTAVDIGGIDDAVTAVGDMMLLESVGPLP
jgi:hypothetical protein